MIQANIIDMISTDHLQRELNKAQRHILIKALVNVFSENKENAVAKAQTKIASITELQPSPYLTRFSAQPLTGEYQEEYKTGITK
jgi:hypothetical protein